MKISSYIDNLDEQMAERLRVESRLGRNRFAVVLDRIDGDHIDIDLHFRLVELTATGPLETDDANPREAGDVSLGTGGGIEMFYRPPADPKGPVNIRRLSRLLKSLGMMTDAPGILYRSATDIEEWLRGTD